MKKPRRLRTTVLLNLFLFLFLFCFYNSHGQSCFGIGIGPENLHLGGKLRNWVPHISYEYIVSDMRTSLYIDAVMIKRNAESSDGYINEQGQSISYLESFNYSHILFQLGFKKFLNGDSDKKIPVFFAGGGLSDCISINRRTAKGTDPQYPVFGKNKEVLNSYGLGLLAGVHYYLKPVFIQLKCNADLMVKPIAEYGGTTNVHTDTRLAVLLPIHSLN